MEQQTDHQSIPAGVSESDFLQTQADEAKAALAAAAVQLKAALMENVDPREITRKHPFVAIGSVATLSFVAALLAIPSKEQQELRRLERVRRAMNPPPPPVAPSGAGATAAPAKDSKPLWWTIVREGIQAARPLLTSLITASIAAHKAGDQGDARSQG